MDYLGHKALNSLNRYDKKYLWSNSATNINIYINYNYNMSNVQFIFKFIFNV